MFDIGIGEIAIMLVIGLLIFGPDKLPKAAADAARWLRQIRTMATAARDELHSAVGDNGEVTESLDSLKQFHPKTLINDIVNGDPSTEEPAATTTDSDRETPAANTEPATVEPVEPETVSLPDEPVAVVAPPVTAPVKPVARKPASKKAVKKSTLAPEVSPATKAPARKTTAAKKTTPAKKATAAKKTTAKKATPAPKEVDSE